MLKTDVIIEELCYQGFHIIDNFLDPEIYQALRTYVQEKNQQNQFRKAKIGRQSQTHHNVDIRTDSIMWIDAESCSVEVHHYIDQLSQLAQLLNESLYLGLTELEMHFAVYAPGSFYKRHVDQFATTKSRKISCVYYLNDDWLEEYQGELKLYDKENNLLRNVLPIGNRLICFNSELPHEVNPTLKTRYSITTWMKTRSDNPSTV
ncbi:2OG-Fe(II) oxygenase [Legionella waltersii]|uniref:SM-20-like protein n=1 Tax=Legionella waltersii TaxID=66969 RepID=A0A0W1A2A5_9GAMM|nr:2OG-Fe(II) oxygenase [Legionella waltersii]KTD75502.1 SM-20-like protein [Legionella waltersii]SNU98363.1 SM-20-like protein [Legionella waltersii]